MAVKPLASPIPTTVEQLPLSESDRAERLALLAARLRSPDGLDRETLARIEQLTGDEQ